jgi:hypothetical protein
MVTTQLFSKYRNFKLSVEEEQTRIRDRLKAILAENPSVASSSSSSSMKAEYKELASSLVSDQDRDLLLMEQLRESMETSFTPQLLEVVSEIQEFSTQLRDIDRLTPEEARSVPLNFVKALCHALSLDPYLETEVIRLKRTLLAQLGIKEYSEEAHFEDNASLSFVLRDTICSYCNASVDIDLLRHPIVINENEEERWKCLICGHQYDLVEIEMNLIDIVNQKLASFLLQDFRDPKTNFILDRKLSLGTTSGSMLSGGSVIYKGLEQNAMVDSEGHALVKMDIPTSDLEQELGILMLVAETHNFNWLKEVLSNLI